MSIQSALRRFAQDWHEARTNRIIGSLPMDIRKDIGWPDAQRSLPQRNVKRPAMRRTHGASEQAA